MHYDLTVVGDGIYGLLLAYFSAYAGLKVRLVGKVRNQEFSSSYRSEAFSHDLGEDPKYEIFESKKFYEMLLNRQEKPFPVFTYSRKTSSSDVVSQIHPFKNENGPLTCESAGFGHKFDAKEILSKLEREIIILNVERLNIGNSIQDTNTIIATNESNFKKFVTRDSSLVIYAMGPWSQPYLDFAKIKKILIFNVTLENEPFEIGLHVYPGKDSFLFRKDLAHGIISVNTKNYLDHLSNSDDFYYLPENEKSLANQLIQENFNLSKESLNSINLKWIGFDLYCLETKSSNLIKSDSHKEYRVPPMNGQGFKNAPAKCINYLKEVFKYTKFEQPFLESISKVTK